MGVRSVSLQRRALVLALSGWSALHGCGSGDESTGGVRGGEDTPMSGGGGQGSSADAGDLFGDQPTVPTQVGDGGPTLPPEPEAGDCGAGCAAPQEEVRTSASSNCFMLRVCLNPAPFIK